MTTEIRHIVFDIGKVLIHYDPNIPYSRVIPDEEKRAWFFAHVCTHDWNLEQDRGRTWEEAEALLIAEHPGHAEEIRAFRKYWREMVSHAYEDTVAIMEELIADGIDVTMLTNFASDTFREAQTMFPFLTKPRGVTVSGDIKLIKPDVAIYETHAKSFDLDPAATIFIDDSLANVEGAKAAGWQAVHFTGAAKLREDLAAYGIRISPTGFDPVERCRRYFEVLDAMDYPAIEAFYADDVTYVSNGVGSLSGREEVMAAIRGYFANYPDQTSSTKSLEAVTPLSVRAVWSVRATHKGTGKPLVREGEETITFNAAGQVVSVDVTDYQAF